MVPALVCGAQFSQLSVMIAQIVTPAQAAIFFLTMALY